MSGVVVGGKWEPWPGVWCEEHARWETLTEALDERTEKYIRTHTINWDALFEPEKGVR